MTIPKLNFKQVTIFLLAISLCGYVGTTLLAQQPQGKQWMAKYESGTEPIKRLPGRKSAPSRSTDVKVTLTTESIVCEPKVGSQITIPLAKVKGVTYGTRVRKRTEEGEALMSQSPLAGIIVASTTQTKHYVTIESQENGTEKEVVLELGKNDYLAFLNELKNATGKDWKDLAQERKNTEVELRREKDKAIAVKLERAVLVGGVNLKPGQYQLVVLERPENKGELHFFVEKVIPESSLASVQVEIVAETSDIKSPELVYKETGGPASLSEIKLPTRKLRLLNAKDALTYVWIPPGTFQMGCSPGDSECRGDEKPAHTVTITKGFWMGQTEVTQGAYQRVMSANPSYFRGNRLPVESVLWNEANAYCTAVGMRLPTEAEWEYAARAGSTASRYGDLDAIAWYGVNSGGQTHEAAQKGPNAWKLHDMLGNVENWVGDWYDKNYYRQSPSQDPRGPSSGRYRVLRGVSWNAVARYVPRVSTRSRLVPGFRSYSIGFRCVWE